MNKSRDDQLNATANRLRLRAEELIREDLGAVTSEEDRSRAQAIADRVFGDNWDVRVERMVGVSTFAVLVRQYFGGAE